MVPGIKTKVRPHLLCPCPCERFPANSTPRISHNDFPMCSQCEMFMSGYVWILDAIDFPRLWWLLSSSVGLIGCKKRFEDQGKCPTLWAIRPSCASLQEVRLVGAATCWFPNVPNVACKVPPPPPPPSLPPSLAPSPEV